MTKVQRKEAKGKKERKQARNLATKYRQGKIYKMVKFDDVAVLLDGPYSMFHTKAMVDALILLTVELRGSVSVRPFNVGQDVPVVKQIP